MSTLSRACAVFSASLVLAACSSNHNQVVSNQVAPGTAAQPVLSADEAANFTAKNALSFGGPSMAAQPRTWTPDLAKISNAGTEYVVGPKLGVDGANYVGVQAAINAALHKHNHGERIFIKIQPGTYTGAVYIPAGAAPITLLGTGNSADEVVLQLGLDASLTPQAYRATVSPNGEFIPGDRAWYMFNLCANPQHSYIGNACSATLWTQADGLQLTNLTIVNSLLDKADADAHPAVALNVDADRVLLDNVHLIGRQNTLMINTNDINNQPVSNHYNRLYVNNSVIEGDVDYVTGYGNAVFNQVDFHTVSSRGVKQASVFAANTPAYVPYGFLVTHSTFTGDKGFASKQAIKAQLGRAWDLGAEGGYVAGQTSNSVVVIRDSQIDSSYNLLHPWGVAAFSQRPFNGNITPNRNVNDPNFNRLWQYNNILATE